MSSDKIDSARSQKDEKILVRPLFTPFEHEGIPYTARLHRALVSLICSVPQAGEAGELGESTAKNLLPLQVGRPLFSFNF